VLGLPIAQSTAGGVADHLDHLQGAILAQEEINAAGGILSPFDSYLVLRGIKTLGMRMERHAANAMRIAKFLESHSKVNRVIYPGLSSFAQYELAQKQMSGFGSMMAAELKGDLSTAKEFVQNLHLFALAESLGGVESLIELPALMTHASVPAEDRKRLGISDTLIRISVGVEDVDDLIKDLEKALETV